MPGSGYHSKVPARGNVNNDVYADLLRIAIRATGDFRFPDLAPSDDFEEEIGFLVYGSNDWNQAEIRQSLRQFTYGIEVKRITDTYEDTSAGADAAFLSFLVEVGRRFLLTWERKRRRA